MINIVAPITWLVVLLFIIILPACPLSDRPFGDRANTSHPPSSLREINADSPVVAIGAKSWPGGKDYVHSRVGSGGYYVFQYTSIHLPL